MNNTDLITMLGNLGQSLTSVEQLIAGLSYLSGIVAVYVGLMKIKRNAESGGRGQEGHSVGISFILGGIALLYLPSSFKMLSDTAFGTHNILQYSNYHTPNIYDSIGILIQMAGLFWFVRGCIILIQSSKPGAQESHKGFFYICAGTLALNFTLTTSAVEYIVNSLVSSSFTFKKITGF